MECMHPITIKNPRYPSCPTAMQYIVVPCGKCIACIDRKAKDWSFRLQNELKNSEGCSFVTLTYSEENLPEGENVDKRDVQLFIKRLRKSLGKSVRLRYFLVSEYGPTSFRPHYHALLFNFKPTKLNGKLLEKCWHKGFVQCAPVTAGRIAYVCRYAFKPKNLPAGRTNTFLLSSRRPGIGINFLTPEMVDYLQKSPTVVINKNGKKVRLPDYYKRKVYNSEQLQIVHQLGENYRRLVDKHRKEEYESSEEYGKLELDRKLLARNRLLAKYLKKMNPKKI